VAGSIDENWLPFALGKGHELVVAHAAFGYNQDVRPCVCPIRKGLCLSAPNLFTLSVHVLVACHISHCTLPLSSPISQVKKYLADEFGWWQLPVDGKLASQRFLTTTDFLNTPTIGDDEVLLFALVSLCRDLQLECIMPRFQCARYRSLPKSQPCGFYCPDGQLCCSWRNRRPHCGVNYAVPSVPSLNKFLGSGRYVRAHELIDRRLTRMGFAIIATHLNCSAPGRGEAFAELKNAVKADMGTKAIWELSHSSLLCAATYTLSGDTDQSGSARCCWNRVIQPCSEHSDCDRGGEGCIKSGTVTQEYGKSVCNVRNVHKCQLSSDACKVFEANGDSLN